MFHGGGSGGYGAGSDYQQQSQQQQQQHGQQLQAPVYVPSSRPAIPSAATAAQYHSFPTSASPAWYVIYSFPYSCTKPVKGRSRLVRRPARFYLHDTHAETVIATETVMRGKKQKSTRDFARHITRATRSNVRRSDRREKTASWQHGVDTYAAHHALAGHTSGTAAAMGPHAGHGHPHAGHPHTAHPHSSLAAAAPFYAAQNVAMMSSWRAYDGAGFQRASPYGSYPSGVSVEVSDERRIESSLRCCPQLTLCALFVNCAKRGRRLIMLWRFGVKRKQFAIRPKFTTTRLA